MGDERWWRHTPREELYALNADARLLDRSQKALCSEGWIPADATYFPAGANLLRTYLAELPEPDVEDLLNEVQTFAERPRPDLPFPSNALSPVAGAPARAMESEALWVDPARVFPGRDGMGAFFRDQGDWSRVPYPGPWVQRNEPARGLAEFAARIAAERGDPRGLTELFGPAFGTSEPMLSLQGWETPLGAVFQVHINGNHRLGALAALHVPCVLAEVTWMHGPFDTTSGINAKEDELRSSYRSLLHAFGVASYPDPEDLGRNFTGIITQWPILIDTPERAVASLRAMESLAGRQTPEIGRLPRALFDAPTQLTRLGEEVREALNAIAVSSAPLSPRPRRLLDRFRRT